MKNFSMRKINIARKALKDAESRLTYLERDAKNGYWVSSDTLDRANADFKQRSEEFARACSKLNDIIAESEGRASARTITAVDIADELEKIEERLSISKRAMQDVKVEVDCNAQSFPSAYGYTPYSTWFTAVYKSGSWTITDIYRYKTAGATSGHYITLTDAAKKAILDRISTF